MDVQKQVELFKSLPYDTRRSKVTQMLNQLQSTHKTFAMFYKTISSLEKVSDNSLVYMYQSILEIAQDIRAWNNASAQDRIQKFWEIIAEIQRQEDLDRQHEWNPEDMLKNI